MHDNIKLFHKSSVFTIFQMSWPFSTHKLDMFQTSGGKSQPIILIVKSFFIFFPRWVGLSPDELAVADELAEGLAHNTLE